MLSLDKVTDAPLFSYRAQLPIKEEKTIITLLFFVF